MRRRVRGNPSPMRRRGLRSSRMRGGIGPAKVARVASPHPPTSRAPSPSGRAGASGIDHPAPQQRRRSPRSGPLGGRGGNSARDRGTWLEARCGPAAADRAQPRPFRAVRRDVIRAGGARVVGAGRHAVAEIERMLSDRNQMLAFEPMDFGPLFGGRADAARSAACSPPMPAARAASRPAPRATMSLA